jgi:hypothetical protein
MREEGSSLKRCSCPSWYWRGSRRRVSLEKAHDRDHTIQVEVSAQSSAAMKREEGL